MVKVRKLMEAGLDTSDAIKHALDIGIGEFCEKYDLVRPIVSDIVNSRRVPNERYLNAFIAELGGTPEEWREMLWLAAKPASLPATESAA